MQIKSCFDVNFVSIVKRVVIPKQGDPICVTVTNYGRVIKLGWKKVFKTGSSLEREQKMKLHEKKSSEIELFLLFNLRTLKRKDL